MIGFGFRIESIGEIGKMSKLARQDKDRKRAKVKEQELE